jgi:S-DNA-T family DNA segregation ATPase FtsK/SpoIIIE
MPVQDWLTTGAVMGGGVAFAGYKAKRWFRLPPHVRDEECFARRIQRTWPELAFSLGLREEDAQPRFDRNGRQLPPRSYIPKGKARPASGGAVLTVATVPGIGVEEYRAVLGHLGNAWGAERVMVDQFTPGTVMIKVQVVDTLKTVLPGTFCATVPNLRQISLGWEDTRDEYILDPAGHPGMTVAGSPGTGKTEFVKRLVARTAASPSVQYAFINGKGSADYEDMAVRAFAHCGDDMLTAAELIERVWLEMRRRHARIRAELGVRNFWHHGPTPAWPWLVLVIDEAHSFFYVNKNAAAPEELRAAHRINRMIEQLVKKGRDVGLLTVLITQKSTGDAIPTAIRDVCKLKFSFAQETGEAVLAALGPAIRLYPDANPLFLQDEDYVGVCVTRRQRAKGYTRLRVPYHPDAEIAELCRATAHLVQDPCRPVLVKAA